MLDLSLIRDSETFSITSGSVRIALIHHGFRTTQLGLKLGQKTSHQLRFAPRFASLGLLNLARSLEIDFEQGRIPVAPEVRYFDEDCFDDDDDLARSITEWLRPASGRFVLVGLYSLAIERTAGLLKKLDPQVFCIVVGGAHPTVAPETDYAHIAVRGEGGAALRHILTHLLEPTFGTGLDARGLCFELGGEKHVGRPAFDRSLATIPPPAFPFELSQSRSDPSQRPRVRWWMAVGKSPQIYICTQSCRARCSFCSTYLIHGRAVSRPVNYIEGDLNYIIDELEHDSIEFHDDDLLQHEQFKELMALLEHRQISWTCNARSEVMTSDIAAEMAAAGCKRVFIGVESLDQKSLDYYKKATTVEMNEEAVLALDAAGIGVVCGFIIGAPHDTLESSLADIDRMLSLPAFFLSPSILTPDIGTVEYHRARRANPTIRLLGDEGSNVNIKPRPELFGSEAPYGMPTVCDALSKRDLNELYALASCEFFLRASTLRRINRLTDADRLADVGVWYDLMRERAAKLASGARIDVIKRRAHRLVDGIDELSVSQPMRLTTAGPAASAPPS